MKWIHREGYTYVTIATLMSIALYVCFIYMGRLYLLLTFFVAFFILIFSLQFFRVPKRSLPHSLSDQDLICPADGQIVVKEHLPDKRIQISIFMSPLNVHINWMPINGDIIRSEYIPGKYLVAWHPKSSTENERHEVDIEAYNNHIITVKQIAGAVARRIRNYVPEGSHVERGEELGFIKFGSRVDVILPEGSQIHVSIDQKVKGKITKLATLPLSTS